MIGPHRWVSELKRRKVVRVELVDAASTFVAPVRRPDPGAQLIRASDDVHPDDRVSLMRQHAEK